MKILCFHPALAPYRVDFFNRLAERVELKILFLQHNLMTQKFDQKALRSELKCCHAELTHGFDIRQRAFRFGVMRAVQRESPDVVFSYEASPVTLQLCILKKLHLIKARIWTFMDDSPVQVRSRNGMRRFIRDWVVRNVEKVIVPSQAAAAAYLVGNTQLADSRFSVIPIIHDTVMMRRNSREVYSMGKAWRREHCPQGWTRIMLFVGRLAEIKNIPWLIDRLAELPTATGFVIVGDGPMEPLLKEKVAEMGLENRIVFAGRKSGDELYAIMAASDLLVLASKSETFGAVVAEALQWGTPCVVSDNCGVAVLIEDGKNGVVFKYDDKLGFVDACKRVPHRSGESFLTVELKDSVSALVGSCI